MTAHSPCSNAFFLQQQAQPPRQPTGAEIINVAAPSTTARPATRSRGEEDETHDKLTRSEIDLKEKGKKTMNRSGPKKKEKLKSTACCVFGCFAGHRRRRETEKRKTFPIHQFCHLHQRRRVNPRQWRWRVEQRAATVPTLFPRIYLCFL